MKVLKGIGLVVVCIPVLLVALFVAYELVGAAVNHAATAAQTERLKKTLRAELPSAEILDAYAETGNTSGTGNHVDMLSVVLFRTEAGELEIAEKLKDGLDWDGGEGRWVAQAAAIQAEHERDGYAFSFLDGLACPEDLEHCYILYWNESAPFADNIEGH